MDYILFIYIQVQVIIFTAFIYNSCMQFEKIIKNQSIQTIPLSKFEPKVDFIQSLLNTHRTVKKSEGKEEKIMASKNEIKTIHDIPTQKSSERLLVQSSSHIQSKQESHLTPQQRKVVGDISKLFNSETSKPTKLLIRLNQTQSNKGSKNTENNSFSESRLEKIEITRLNEQTEHNIMDFMKLPTELTSNEELTSKIKENDPYNYSIESSIKIMHQSEVGTPMQSTKLSIFKQISIMYVPDLNMSTLIGMKNPPQLFSKFNKKVEQKCLDSLGSNFSNDFTEKKQKQETSNSYVKLLEIELFLKRRQVKYQRSEQLRLANEKMLSSHLIDKENLEKARIFVEKLEESYRKKIQQLNKQLEEERKTNAQLLFEIETKQKSIKSNLKLNEQYLKQNNELKSKIKDYLKHIHELKSQLTNKQKQRNDELQKNNQQAINDKKSLPPPSIPKLSFEAKTNNDYGRLNVPKSPRKEVTFNEVCQQKDLNSKFYGANPYYTAQMNDKFAYNYSKMQQKEKTEQKLSNCRSQGLLNRPQPSKNQNKDTKQKQYDLTSRSYKATGIRKNNLNQQPISPSTRNLVRVNKNIINDASIVIGDKLRDNKSLSSYSNLSGKSLSQRIGYISKPVPNDKNRGMLVDYMIEDNGPEKNEDNVKEPTERFKFRRENA